MKPPNLRMSDGESSCSSCVHYSKNHCKRYDHPVRPSQLSDGFKRRDDQPQDKGSSGKPKITRSELMEQFGG